MFYRKYIKHDGFRYAASYPFAIGNMKLPKSPQKRKGRLYDKAECVLRTKPNITSGHISLAKSDCFGPSLPTCVLRKRKQWNNTQHCL